LSDLGVREDIIEMLEEDVGEGDVTSEALIDEGIGAEAEIIADQSGYVAGIPETLVFFEEMGVEAEAKVSDGVKIDVGDVLVEIEGSVRGILAAERVALNLLSRMSGIATGTMEMVEEARKVDDDVKIAATRKTAPLLRRFDKRAVSAVGGEPHRYHLADFILIKDNHLKFVDSIGEAVRKAKESGLSENVEVEVNSKEGAVEAVEAEADIVMLDNFEPEEVGEALDLLEEKSLRDDIMIEASGGIDPSNVADYAEHGVDVISGSYMTKRAPALDVKLEILD